VEARRALETRGRLRLARRIALPAAILLATLVTAQEPRTLPTFPAAVELVTVDAVVLDGKGQPVSGLTAQDFSLFEDGRPQAIVSFEGFAAGTSAEPAVPSAIPGPVATNEGARALAAAGSFVLLVDDVGLAPARQETVRTALRRFLEEGVRAGDELIFATTSGDAWWSARMPDGREDILALIARLRGRMLSDAANDGVSEWEAYRITHFEGRGGDGNATGRPDTEDTPLNLQPLGGPPEFAAGAELTQRVVDRYYQRRVCIPDPIRPGGPPMTPPKVCRSMVQARAGQVDQRRVSRTRDVLTGVDRAVFALTGVRGRKALLLLTEGFLNDPDLGAVQEVAGRCREANLAVYSLDVRGLMTGLTDAAEVSPQGAFELAAMQVEQIESQTAGSVGLAEDTGGFAVRNTNDLAGGARQVAEESRVYYLLGYAPPEGKGPRDWRKLRLEVNRPGLKVRARKGYTLRSAGEILAAAEGRVKSRAPRPNPRTEPAAGTAPLLPADVARALVSAREADTIPIRAMAYALEGRPTGLVRTLVAVEIAMRNLANLGGELRPRTVLTLSIAASQRDTGKTQRIDNRLEVESGAGAPRASEAWEEGWFTLTREFDLAPGVTQARLVVRDEFLGRLGAVTLRFVVPPAAGLRLSTPMLADRLSPSKEGAPSRPILAAHREFAAESRLYCQFEVFGAATRSGARPQVAAAYELRRTNGDVVQKSEGRLVEPTPDGRVVRLLTLALDGVAQGDYQLVLRIEDRTTGETREQIEPLRVTRRRG
jgi:VWFA-related protein